MSSSKQNPVYQSDVTQTICGRSSDAKHGGYYEFQWHNAWAKIRKNQNGTTGWATIIHSTNPACKPKTICRIHLCAYTPCEVSWPVSKYGSAGPQYICKRRQSRANYPQSRNPLAHSYHCLQQLKPQSRDPQVKRPHLQLSLHQWGQLL